MSRTKNALKNINASIINQLVLIISGLILPRMLIENYGSEINGLVSTIKQMVNYGSVFVIGLGAASSAALYGPIYDKNTDKINGILSSTKKTYLQSGLYFAVLIILIAFLFPIISENEIDTIITVSIIVLAGIGALVEHILISTYRVFLIADQQANVQSRYQTYGFIVYTVLAIIFIQFNLSIIFVLLSLLISNILRYFLIRRYVLEKYPFINLNDRTNAVLIKNRWDAFLYQIPDMLITYTPTIVIALMIGLKEASIYSVYNIVFSSLMSIIGVVSFGIQGGFGNLLSSNDNALLRKSYNSYQFGFTIVTFFMYGCAFLLIKPFISVYVQGADDVNYMLPFIGSAFALSGISRMIRTPAKMLIESAGRFSDNKLHNIAEAILNLIISIILVSKLGILGVLISSGLTSLARSFMYINYAHKKILYQKSHKYYLQMLINMSIIFIFSFVFTKTESTSFFSWGVYAVYVSVVVGSVLTLVNTLIDKSSTRDILNRIKFIITK